MKRWRIPAVVVASSIAAVLCILAYIHRQNPMLLHLFADSSCACSDYDEEVSGLTLLNPFRDRLPEASADIFFENLRQGQCPMMAQEVTAADCVFLREHRSVSEWKLMTRQDLPHRVSLYYKLTQLGSEPRFRLTGVGYVEVIEITGAWKVRVFDAQF